MTRESRSPSTIPPRSSYPQPPPIPIQFYPRSNNTSPLSSLNGSPKLNTPSKTDLTTNQEYMDEPPSPLPGNNVADSHRSSHIDMMEDEDTIIVNGDDREDTPESTDPTEVDEETAESLGRGMKEMYHMVNQLRASGVEDLNVPLPKIAVVGNQSAGKSSLIEAISGITVPRQSGTCTRCPMEISLMESEPNEEWSCEISLRHNFSYEKPKRAGKSPWTSINQQQHHFISVGSKEDVEDALIRAQCAILNPEKRWHKYARLTTDINVERKNSQVQFSPNVVCVDIKGPGLPNLAFIDLPGLFHVTEKPEDAYLIKLVVELVISHIKTDNCLVLLAMTMKDDAVNQSAVNLAMRYCKGRTIGALTKPDTLTKGEHEQWIDVLMGKSHVLHPHGYFVTKQPSQNELLDKISHSEARKREREFFEKTEPWATGLLEFSHKFGTTNLQAYLAEKLGDLIKESLPTLIDKVNSEINCIDAEVKLLPAPNNENCSNQVLNLIDRVDRRLGEVLEGIRGTNLFPQQFAVISKQFQQELRNIRPRLNPDDKAAIDKESPFASDNALRRDFQRSMSIQSSHAGDYEGPAEDSANGNKRRADGQQSDPRKRHRVAEGQDETMGNTGDGEQPLAPPKKKPDLFMHLKEVRGIIRQVGITPIPGTTDSKCVETITQLWIRLWDPVVERLLDRTHSLLQSSASEVVGLALGRYQNTLFMQKTEQFTQEFITEKFLETAREQISMMYSLERDYPATSNVEDLSREKGLASSALRNRRNTAIADQLQQTNQLQTPTKRKENARPEIDAYETEIDTMVHVTAYSTIARRRFSDNCAMVVNGLTVPAITTKFKDYIKERYKINPAKMDEHACKMLLASDPKQLQRRHDFLARRVLLQNAYDELTKFM